MSKKIKKILTGAAGIVSFAGVASGVAVTQNAENPVVYKSFEQKITGQTRTFSDSWTDVRAADGRQHYYKSRVSVGGSSEEKSHITTPFSGLMNSSDLYYGSINISSEENNLNEIEISYEGTQHEGGSTFGDYNKKTSLSLETLGVDTDSEYNITINYSIQYSSYIQQEALWWRHSMNSTLSIDSITYNVAVGTQVEYKGNLGHANLTDHFTTYVLETPYYGGYEYNYLDSEVTIGGESVYSSEKYKSTGQETIDERKVTKISMDVSNLSNMESIRTFTMKANHKGNQNPNYKFDGNNWQREENATLKVLESINTQKFDSMTANFTLTQRLYQGRTPIMPPFADWTTHEFITDYVLDSIILTV